MTNRWLLANLCQPWTNAPHASLHAVGCKSIQRVCELQTRLPISARLAGLKLCARNRCYFPAILAQNCAFGYIRQT